MTQRVDEVYENQRFIGLWKAPLSVLDAPAWSDSTGAPVVLERPPPEDPAAWELVANPATDDAEGWQYGTVFKHLEYKRAGGRSSARFGDTVRRRLWRRRCGSDSEAAPALAVTAAGGEAATAAAAAAAAVGAGESVAAEAAALAAAREVREARETEARKKAVKAFLALVLDLLSRRQVWTLVPWDPTAPFLLARKHSQVYQELQAQAYERRLFMADQEAPPSLLRQGRTLLQDLLCAAMHARAAYGFPLAAGLMSDVPSYIRLQTLQPLTFDAVGGVSPEANNEAVAALTGLASPDDLLMAEWRNSPYRPCHYVAIDRANQCIVLSIRGSLQLGDLLSDLAAAPMEVTVGGVPGYVHQARTRWDGIMSAATYVHCNTAEALREAARRCPGWPLMLAGHSLGGGVAALLCLLLQDTGMPAGLGPVHCLTMGTAAVMSRPLAEACNGRVTSVILGSDCIPHLSAASVEALLLEASQESPVRRTVEGWGAKLAGAVSTAQATASRQRELSSAALAALSGGQIPDNWTAVKQASARLQQSASGAGLARVASLIAETAGRSVSGAQQAGAAPRQIPVVEQQPPPPPPQLQGQQQQQQGQGPRQIPVIDLGQPAGQQQQQQQPATVAAASSATAAAAAAAAAQQQQQQEEAVLTPLYDFDAGLAEAAGAQEAAAQAAAASAAPLAAAGGGNGAAGSPEHLFPPGRIVWLFPEEESVVDEAEGALQAMDAAWAGSAGPPEGDDGEGGAPPRWQHASSAAAAAASAAQEPTSHPTHQPHPEHEAVNMEEALHSVEAGVRGAESVAAAAAAASGSGGGGGGSGGRPGERRSPVVADADRGSFERILLMPDMFNDHLPDAYLAALQQL